jgi:TolB protein
MRRRAHGSRVGPEMVRRLMLTAIALALLLGAGASRANNGYALAKQCDSANPPCFQLESTIAFTSTRDGNGEIYVMNPDLTNPDPRRLTNNAAGDGFAGLSPNGKKIVSDSDRLTGRVNSSDLFLMDTDGSEQTLVTRGSSATWSPDSKNIAFHASASYHASGGLVTGTPIRNDPGSATTDSDIFVVNVDDLLQGFEQPRNITNTPNKIDDDPDWSPDGQKLVFTNHDAGDPNHNSPLSAEIYVLNADGRGAPEQLTFNAEEERAPAWSPDGTRIIFNCRRGGPDFEICVMNGDGTGQVQLTNNAVPDLTATWSPDGQQIVFHRLVAGQGLQLFTMNPTLNADGMLPTATQLTSPPGLNLLANWGELRVHVTP